MSKETAPKSGPGPGIQDVNPESEPQGQPSPTPSTVASSSSLSENGASHEASASAKSSIRVQNRSRRAEATLPERSEATTLVNGSSTDATPASRAHFHPGDVPLVGVAGLPAGRVPPTTGEYLAMSRSRRRALIRLGVLLLLLALIVDLFSLSPLTDPAANLTPRVPDGVPLSEVQPYGVNTFLQKEVESWKKDQTMQMARDLGVGWIKQQFPWAEIEYRTDPQRPFWDVKNNQNAWAKFDGIVSLAQQYNLRIIARIDSAPVWSHPNNASLKAPPDADHMVDFGAFIDAFVTRYRGTVSAIQVWNEPNLKDEWATGKPVNAAEYTALLKTAYESAKQADPDMIVLAAPLATNNESLAYAGNLNELDYLQQMYDAGAGQYFDAMAANAYGTKYAPEDPPSPQKLNFRRVELLHGVMDKNGDANKSVWFNEYGWNASPADMDPSKLIWNRVTPEQQADYTVRGIQYARENWPWAGVFTIWYLRQVGDTAPTESEYYFGLVDPDFIPTPAYRAVQKAALTEEKVATPGGWGPLSAAVQAPPQWAIRLDSSVPGGMYITPTSLGSKLDVTFLGNDVKMMLVPPGNGDNEQVIAARYYVTIDGSPSKVAPELPRDVNGQAYIDVPAGSTSTEVVLARGINAEMRTGQHLLEVTVAANPAGVAPRAGGAAYAPVVQRPDLPGIGIITVEVHRSYILFTLLTLLLLAAIGIAVWVLRRSPSFVLPPGSASAVPEPPQPPTETSL